MAGAAGSQSITIVGLPQAEARFAEMAAAVKIGMPIALMAGGEVISNAAKGYSPYKTGNLQRSIHVESRDSTTIAVGTDVEYAAAQEFGTSRGVPPHPYMRPAFDTTQAAVAAEIALALRRLLGV